MAIEISGQVGPQVLNDGSTQPFRQDKTGALVVQELHGRYYEQVYRKNVFTAYSTARAITVVGTAMVGLQLWNSSPVSGGVNLVLLKTGGLISVTSATTTGLILASGIGQVSAPTGQTAADAVKNNYISGTSPQATAIAAGTFTNAPTGLLTLMHNTAAIGATGEDPGYFVDLEGSIIVPPQTYVCIAALGATAAALAWTGFLMWEEVPV
jgi:hypothetical protein